MAVQTEIGKICIIETVIFYVDPKSVGPLNFLEKERIRFPVTNEHFLLTVFEKKRTGATECESCSDQTIFWYILGLPL